MTQEMCEDIDFLTERRGVVDDDDVVERGYDDLLRRSSKNAAAAEEDKEEEWWNSSLPPPSEDERSVGDESVNDEDLWEAIHESQLEISQSQKLQSQSSSSQCATAAPFCEENENPSDIGIQKESENLKVESPFAAATNVIANGDSEEEGESSPVVVTLESFLDEEVKEEQQMGGHGEVDSAQMLPPCDDMLEISSNPPPRIEENNEELESSRSGKTPACVAIVERGFFVKETKEEQQDYDEMNDELSSHDPTEISVATKGNELGLLRPANDEVVEQIGNEVVSCKLFFITALASFFHHLKSITLML